ncbi:hypothetical protein UlMin_015129 [Ulmus minor]
MFRMNKLQRLKTDGSGGRMSAWVDSMRASSPHVKSTSSHSETDEKKSWTLQHPSALSRFEQLTNASKGKHIVMFLDYDGTLHPLLKTGIELSSVRAVNRYFPTIVVSGRFYSFVRLAELYYTGSHGVDIRGPSKCCKNKNGVPWQPATEFLPMVNEVYKILLDETKSILGTIVEHNKFYISVHFHCVDEKISSLRFSEFKYPTQAVMKNHTTIGHLFMLQSLTVRDDIKYNSVLNEDNTYIELYIIYYNCY